MLNNDQQYAKGYMDKGCNIFLTGEAGTGKSYLINNYIQQCERQRKQVMVVAPTGVAALNVNGATIHRSFRAPLGPLIEKPKSLPKTLISVDVLICDEISMCRVDLFDYMIYQIMSANVYRRNHGKQDIQVIVVGDFFQLPPVLTPGDQSVLRTKYPRLDRGYAFESQYWDQCNFISINLREPMRQTNTEFLDNLNKARRGDKSCLKYFRENSRTDYNDDILSIVGKNATADEINTRKIQELVGPMMTYFAETDGKVKESDKMVPEVLELKIGARVMLMVNEPKGLYSNGSFGTIRKLDKNSLLVEIDESGEKVKLEPYTWEIIDYSVSNGKIKADVIGTYKQFPLKVGYAITIHKSQGQTYDKVNIDPVCWDCGQLYVALSRCKSIEGMHFIGELQNNYLVVSDKVQQLYSKLQK